MTDEKLLELALDARKNAYVPYSGYAVGAALLAEDGRVFTGCNVENAAYGNTLPPVYKNRDCVRRFRAVSVRCMPSVAL